jgi:hypothetical protein
MRQLSDKRIFKKKLLGSWAHLLHAFAICVYVPQLHFFTRTSKITNANYSLLLGTVRQKPHQLVALC